MSNYGKIYNPNTKRWNNVYSTGGRTILEKYIINLQNTHGGGTDFEYKSMLNALEDNIVYNEITPHDFQEYVKTSIYAKVYPLHTDNATAIDWKSDPYSLTLEELTVKDIREILTLDSPAEDSIKYRYKIAALKRKLHGKDDVNANSNAYMFKDLMLSPAVNTLEACAREYSLVDKIGNFNSRQSLGALSDARAALNEDAKLAIELLQQKIKSLEASYYDVAIEKAYMLSAKELDYKIQAAESSVAIRDGAYDGLKEKSLDIKNKMEQLRRFRQENIEATIKSHTSIMNTIANGQEQISDQQEANKRRAREASRDLESAQARLLMNQRHLEEEEAALRYGIELDARHRKLDTLITEAVSIQKLRAAREVIKKAIITCKIELKKMIGAVTDETVKRNQTTRASHSDELEDISLATVIGNTPINTTKIEALEQKRTFVFDLYSGETMLNTRTIYPHPALDDREGKVSPTAYVGQTSTLSRDLHAFETDSTLFDIVNKIVDINTMVRNMRSHDSYPDVYAVPTTVVEFNKDSPVKQAVWYTSSWNTLYNAIVSAAYSVVGDPIQNKRHELATLEQKLLEITKKIEAYDRLRPGYLRLHNVSPELKDYTVVFVDADDTAKTMAVPEKCSSLTRVLDIYLESPADIRHQRLDDLLLYKRQSIEDYIQYIDKTQVSGVHLKYKDVLQSFNDAVSAISTLAEQ